MLIIKTISLLRRHIRNLRQERKCIGLVPTMGNLHNGHMKLVDEAKSQVDVVIVSIFVNPMQFNLIKDLERYPRTLQADYKKLNRRHVDFVFSPTKAEIYPKGVEETTYIEVPGVSRILEGNSRPGHFRGVSTIVSKLFNLVQPDIAFFGEKDFQQLALIRKMVADLNYDINIIGVPIVRAKDGLALSSRNSNLTTKQRKIAPSLRRVINEMEKQLQKKELAIEKIISLARKMLNKSGFHVDDIQIRDAENLLELTKTSHRAVILVSAWLGYVRLIDNKVVFLEN